MFYNQLLTYFWLLAIHRWHQMRNEHLLIDSNTLSAIKDYWSIHTHTLAVNQMCNLLLQYVCAFIYCEVAQENEAKMVMCTCLCGSFLALTLQWWWKHTIKQCLHYLFFLFCEYWVETYLVRHMHKPSNIYKSSLYLQKKLSATSQARKSEIYWTRNLVNISFFLQTAQ